MPRQRKAWTTHKERVAERARRGPGGLRRQARQITSAICAAALAGLHRDPPSSLRRLSIRIPEGRRGHPSRDEVMLVLDTVYAKAYRASFAR